MLPFHAEIEAYCLLPSHRFDSDMIRENGTFRFMPAIKVNRFFLFIVESLNAWAHAFHFKGALNEIFHLR